MTKSAIAIVLGNGSSRLQYSDFINRTEVPVFACNAFYRDFSPHYIKPDFLVAIDDAIIKEIRNSDFPQERFIEPPEVEKWEPVELHWSGSIDPNWNPARPRSNAGINAILEAIKRGYNHLKIMGFDALVVDDSIALSNVYDGTPCYGYDTRANLQDTRNRLRYLCYVMEKNFDVTFEFIFPQLQIYKPDYPNCLLTFTEEMV